MHTALTITAIVLNAAIGVADLATAKFVLATSQAVAAPLLFLGLAAATL